MSRFRRRCYDYETLYNKDLYHNCVKDLSASIAKLMKISGKVSRMDSMMIESNIRRLSRMELVYRLFKLNRMEELQPGNSFPPRSVPFPDLCNERIFPGGIQVRALFEPECKWRLLEEFGTDCFEEQEDGKLMFHADYTDVENLLTWLLTFRDKVTLLEPKELRKELEDFIENMRRRYAEE